ncbi:hypothetical protein AgCh_026264 [Apium graveolens]
MLTDGGEPETYYEAVSHEKKEEWSKAMEEEMRSLQQNHTYDLVKLPKGKRALKNKWVYRLKTDKNSGQTRYKARLVVKGFSQKKGVDFEEIFSPVVKMSSIRVVLGLAAKLNLEVEQLDMKTAFLHGNLEEEIYMEQPEGFRVPGKEDFVCRMRKSLYGLKQAPRQWYKKFDSFMKTHGYRKTSSDHCVFVKRFSEDDSIILLLYVNDMLILGHDASKLEKLKKDLSNTFSMKDLGPAKQILVPFKRKRKKKMEKIPYGSVIGSLMYAMIYTRPDLAHSVGVVSRFLSNPGREHWAAVKWIFRYLKGTSKLCLCYGNGECVLDGFTDADMAGDFDSRKSTSGYLITYTGGAVSWQSRLQRCVALSTTEAEYIAITEACKEVLWMKKFLKDIGQKQKNFVVYCDSQRAIHLNTIALFLSIFSLSLYFMTTMQEDSDDGEVYKVNGHLHLHLHPTGETDVGDDELLMLATDIKKRTRDNSNLKKSKEKLESNLVEGLSTDVDSTDDENYPSSNKRDYPSKDKEPHPSTEKKPVNKAKLAKLNEKYGSVSINFVPGESSQVRKEKKVNVGHLSIKQLNDRLEKIEVKTEAKKKNNRNGKIGINKHNNYTPDKYAPRKICVKCGSVNHLSVNCKLAMLTLMSAPPSFPNMTAMSTMPLNAISTQNMNAQFANMPFAPNPYYAAFNKSEIPKSNEIKPKKPKKKTNKA